MWAKKIQIRHIFRTHKSQGSQICLLSFPVLFSLLFWLVCHSSMNWNCCLKWSDAHNSFSLIDGGLRCWRCLFAVKDDNNNKKEKQTRKVPSIQRKQKSIRVLLRDDRPTQSSAKITNCHRSTARKSNKKQKTEKIVEWMTLVSLLSA